jgi:hypothetical protein
MDVVVGRAIDADERFCETKISGPLTRLEEIRDTLIIMSESFMLSRQRKAYIAGELAWILSQYDED